MTNKFTILIAALFLVACSDSNNTTEQTNTAAKNEKYQIGTHYRPINESLKQLPDQHIVTEFFSYECHQCEAVEPYLENWHKSKDSKIVFQQSPIALSEQADLYAKLFFIASESDNFSALHSRLFKEVDKVRTEKDLELQKAHFAKVFAEYGINEEQFNNGISSFKVKSQVKKAQKLMRASGVTETPSLMVDGRYLILNKDIRSPHDVTNIADFLIDKVSRERGES